MDVTYEDNLVYKFVESAGPLKSHSTTQQLARNEKTVQVRTLQHVWRTYEWEERQCK